MDPLELKAQREREERDRYIARSRAIVKLSDLGWNLEEIGSCFDISDERVRQLIVEAVGVAVYRERYQKHDWGR